MHQSDPFTDEGGLSVFTLPECLTRLLAAPERAVGLESAIKKRFARAFLESIKSGGASRRDPAQRIVLRLFGIPPSLTWKSGYHRRKREVRSPTDRVRCKPFARVRNF